MPEESEPPPTPWTIESVTGRRSSPERGLAPADNMTLRSEDGSAFGIGRFRPASMEEFSVQMLTEVGYHAFDRCPICETSDPTSKEHVPPQHLGGNVLTLTCTRCNNEFGSRLERDLLDWFDDASRTRVTAPGIMGARSGPRILLRQNDEGAGVMVAQPGRRGEVLADAIDAGEFTITWSLPHPQRVKLALLKSAYLAGCALLGYIPDTPLATEIRRLLVAVRDAPRDAPLPSSPVLENLRHFRSYRPANGRVDLVRWRDDGVSGLAVGISLAGTVLVTWPMERLFARRADESGDAKTDETASTQA
ncbi:HNH endonuclease [Microbacterium aquilitoris]|uniref:HNH endonuclease n=1 Tax=Microbacterium aquilitoris TaxID=3067307 RepID=UPI002891C83E|nr:HNH endonuclease [Microbacterium sp. KSW2-22]MDT3343877.1 HNH endonuclease [Microbacterium sp. KSW2-22]